jgi:hypothetical protein
MKETKGQILKKAKPKVPFIKSFADPDPADQGLW